MMTFKEWQSRVPDRVATTTREYRAREAWEQQTVNHAKVLAVAKATVAHFHCCAATDTQTKLLIALEAAVAEVEGKL